MEDGRSTVNSSSLLSSVIPKSAVTYDNLSQLYQNEARDFSVIGGEVRNLLMEVNDKLRQTSSNINELMKKATKQQDVKQKAGKFLDGKSQELKNKNKNIESVVSGMKETVSKIKPEQLADLPVQKQRILSRTFELLYKVLYQSDSNQQVPFKWSTFKKKALKQEGGQDFQSRMANINIRALSQNTYSQILSLKEDPQFNKLSQNQKYSTRLLDLGDWMQYVCKGYQFSNEWKGTQDNYQKIQKNVLRRRLDGVNAKQALEFWKQTHNSTQQFRDYFTDLQSRLKAIQIHFEKNAPILKSQAVQHNKRIQEINSSL